MMNKTLIFRVPTLRLTIRLISHLEPSPADNADVWGDEHYLYGAHDARDGSYPAIDIVNAAMILFGLEGDA